MDTACASPGKYSIPGATAEEFTLSSTTAAGNAVTVSPNLTPPIADAKLGEETFHYNKSL
jgi:hypothetical protein